MKACNSNRRLKIMLLVAVMIVNFSIIVNASSDLINMNFRDADVRDVFRTIAELSDTNLVTDGSVEGDITIRLNNVSFQEALELVTTTHKLAYKWYENTVVVATPERIETIYEEISIKSVKLKYADLSETRELLSSIYSKMDILSDNRNKALILKGKDEDIAAAELFLSKIDTEKNEESEIVPVHYEDIDFLVNYIEKIYPDLVVEENGSGSMVFYGDADNIENAKLLIKDLSEKLADMEDVDGQLMEGVLVQHSDVSYIKEHLNELYPELQVIADTLNSQLILNGKASDISLAKDFIAKLDLPRKKEEIFTEIISVKNADLALVEETLKTFVPNMDIRVVEATGQMYISGNEEDVKLAILTAEKIDMQARQSTGVKHINHISFDDLDGIVSDLFPRVKYRINEQNRELVVTGQKDHVDEVMSFVQQLDRPRKQVIIEARIEEVLTDELEEIGIDPSQLSNIRFLDSSDNGFLDGIELTLPEFLTMLNTNSVSTTLANPSLMAISGEEARLLIGDRLPIPLRDPDGTIVEIEYIDAGISLNFLPVVGDDNLITMDVKPMISTIGDSVGTSIPPINTREAETSVILEEGQMMAIGGLIREEERKNLTKIPLLGDIPYIGQLFRHNTSDKRRTEVFIFIKPRIVDNQPDDSNIDYECYEKDTNEEDNTISDFIEDEEEVNSNSEANIELDTENEKKTDEEKSEKNDKAISVEDSISSNEDDFTFVSLSKEELLSIIGVESEENDSSEIEENKKNEQNDEAEAITEDIIDENEKNSEITEIEKDEKDIEEDEELPEEGVNEEEIEDVDLGDYYLFEYYLEKEISIEELAEKYSTEIELIEMANQNGMEIGSYINIPVDQSQIYVMQKGDTLWSLFRRFGVSVDSLKEFNQITDESNISVGSSLYIPEKF